MAIRTGRSRSRSLDGPSMAHLPSKQVGKEMIPLTDSDFRHAQTFLVVSLGVHTSRCDAREAPLCDATLAHPGMARFSPRWRSVFVPLARYGLRQPRPAGFPKIGVQQRARTDPPRDPLRTPARGTR